MENWIGLDWIGLGAGKEKKKKRQMNTLSGLWVGGECSTSGLELVGQRGTGGVVGEPARRLQRKGVNREGVTNLQRPQWGWRDDTSTVSYLFGVLSDVYVE